MKQKRKRDKMKQKKKCETCPYWDDYLECLKGATEEDPTECVQVEEDQW